MVSSHVFFYTLTIEKFEHLLADDNLKLVILKSLQYLVKAGLVEIYSYVIMPNHIHLLWTILGSNGKESPAGSFAKYTAHRFRNYLVNHHPDILLQYASEKRDRNHQFWKRDALAVPITHEEIFIQKLEYIHNNPINEKWNLCTLPEDYRWSSAQFYLSGHDEFGILKHFRDI
jgi:putative transposase